MKEQIQKPQQESRTIQSKTKAANQASIEQMLQMYRNSSVNMPVQREEFDEDELLQGKFNTLQREEFDDDELLQGKFESSAKTAQRAAFPPSGGEGVLPADLKSGIENLSGYSMDDVQVHYNSPKPAQLQALAYTQGTDIHVAPGQEKHLPHEAWHVVQQKQVRVQPTMQLQGVNINDNEGLEREADVMGAKTMSAKNDHITNTVQKKSSVVQREPTRNVGIDSYSMKNILKGSVPGEQANSIKGNMAHLGWSSMMTFKTIGSKFGEFTSLLGDQVESTNVDQVVTRGVDTCTVIIVSRGDSHIMLHLDAKDLTEANIDIITQAVPIHETDHALPNIFISIIDDRGEEPSVGMLRTMFVRKLICKYLGRAYSLKEDGNLVDSLTEGAPTNHNIRILNRGKMDERLVHPEIGLYIDGTGLKVFGSLASICDIQSGKTLKYVGDEGRIHDFILGINASQDEYEKYAEMRQKIYDKGKSAMDDEFKPKGKKGSGYCYLTTACVEMMGLPDDCEELTVLRQFRDTYLINKPKGKELIGVYYQQAPQILNNIHSRTPEEEKLILLRIYNIIIDCVRAIKQGDNEYAFQTYCNMVISLDKEYN